MDKALAGKYHQLLSIIKQYRRVAVAYSGGVDSTVLARAACDALGSENVVIIHASSTLLPTQVTGAAQRLIQKEFDDGIDFRVLHVDPLADADLVSNDSRRCYICKKLIYRRVLETISVEGTVLLDGTNCDDLQVPRPGLTAIAELGVKTPLVDAGLDKAAVRAIAAALGLSNAALPSNSCLATRIEPGCAIAEPDLRTIELLEDFLISLGFSGCRVRPRGDLAILEFREADLGALATLSRRELISEYFREHGFSKVLIDIQGRN